MAVAFYNNDKFLRLLETPWLHRQVDTHLVFGPLSRNFPAGWLMIAFIAVDVLSKLLSHDKGKIIDGLLRGLIFVPLFMTILKMPKYHQAAFNWFIMKTSCAFIFFIMLIAGGLVGFFAKKPDAIHLTLLGLIWLPSLEFLPKLTEKQKYITISRILLTIPVAYLGFQTGCWH